MQKASRHMLFTEEQKHSWYAWIKKHADWAAQEPLETPPLLFESLSKWLPKTDHTNTTPTSQLLRLWKWVLQPCYVIRKGWYVVIRPDARQAEDLFWLGLVIKITTTSDQIKVQWCSKGLIEDEFPQWVLLDTSDWIHESSVIQVLDLDFNPRYGFNDQ